MRAPRGTACAPPAAPEMRAERAAAAPRLLCWRRPWVWPSPSNWCRVGGVLERAAPAHAPEIIHLASLIAMTFGGVACMINHIWVRRLRLQRVASEPDSCMRRFTDEHACAPLFVRSLLPVALSLESRAAVGRLKLRDACGSLRLRPCHRRRLQSGGADKNRMRHETCAMASSALI